MMATRFDQIKRLSESHRTHVRDHLLRLDSQDRYLRFGCSVGDRQIEQFASEMDFDGLETYGIQDANGQLVAVCQMAFMHGTDGAIEAEFGVSVDASHRRLGLGAQLFAAARQIAVERGAQTFVIYALSQNAAMLSMARAAGAAVVPDGSESVARIALQAQCFARSPVLPGRDG